MSNINNDKLAGQLAKQLADPVGFNQHTLRRLIQLREDNQAVYNDVLRELQHIYHESKDHAEKLDIDAQRAWQSHHTVSTLLATCDALGKEASNRQYKGAQS